MRQAKAEQKELQEVQAILSDYHVKLRMVGWDEADKKVIQQLLDKLHLYFERYLQQIGDNLCKGGGVSLSVGLHCKMHSNGAIISEGHFRTFLQITTGSFDEARNADAA